MEVKRIDLADVRPNENNPRADFGDLDALWGSFALNTANPGEPVNPIVVVADGDVYRIVDGERRYRAMEGHGQESCNALVCEGYDDVEQAVAMLATDDKLSLTPTEACQGIQQMLLLGVPEQRVAAASKAPVESVRAVRRVLNCRKGEGVFQTTLEQMLAVDDVDENGDGDMADAMLADRNWKETYAKFQREREREREFREFESVASDAGYRLLGADFDPDEYGPSRYVYHAGSLAELHEKGYRYAWIEKGAYGTKCMVYLPAGESQGQSAAEAEAERAKAAKEAAMDEARAATDALRREIAAWYRSHMSTGTPHKAEMQIERMVALALFDEDEGELAGNVAEFEELCGQAKGTIAPLQMTYELKAYAFPIVCPELGNYSLSRALAFGMDELEEWGRRHAKEAARDLCAVVNGFVAAGFEPGEAADALMRRCEQILSWTPDEDEGADDGEDE